MNQIVVYAAFRAEEDILLLILQGIIDDSARGANHIRMLEGLRRAFGVHGELGARVLGLGAQHILLRDAVMYWAVTIPKENFLLRALFAHPRAQVSIRYKKEFLCPGSARTILTALDEVTHTSHSALSAAVVLI